jgi:hypothetical protein
MVKKVIQIEDEIAKYRWVKPEILSVVSLLDSEKKVDDMVNSLSISRDRAAANNIVPACCIPVERVCMAALAGSRSFCYFYETLFRKLGVRFPLTSFEIDFLNVV